MLLNVLVCHFGLEGKGRGGDCISATLTDTLPTAQSPRHCRKPQSNPQETESSISPNQTPKNLNPQFGRSNFVHGRTYVSLLPVTLNCNERLSGSQPTGLQYAPVPLPTPNTAVTTCQWQLPIQPTYPFAAMPITRTLAAHLQTVLLQPDRVCMDSLLTLPLNKTTWRADFLLVTAVMLQHNCKKILPNIITAATPLQKNSPTQSSTVATPWLHRHIQPAVHKAVTPSHITTRTSRSRSSAICRDNTPCLPSRTGGQPSAPLCPAPNTANCLGPYTLQPAPAGAGAVPLAPFAGATPLPPCHPGQPASLSPAPRLAPRRTGSASADTLLKGGRLSRDPRLEVWPVSEPWEPLRDKNKEALSSEIALSCGEQASVTRADDRDERVHSRIDKATATNASFKMAVWASPWVQVTGLA